MWPLTLIPWWYWLGAALTAFLYGATDPEGDTSRTETLFMVSTMVVWPLWLLYLVAGGLGAALTLTWREVQGRWRRRQGLRSYRDRVRR